MRNVLYRPPDQRSPARQPENGLLARLGLGAAVAALIAIPFTLLLVLVKSEWGPLSRLDRDVADSLNDFARQHDTLVSGLKFIETATTPWLLRVLVLGIAIWLWLRGARRLAAWAVITVIVGSILAGLLKGLVERARPSFPEPVAHSAGYSFPSGHAFNSLMVTLIVILIFLPVLSRTGRVVAYVVGTTFVLVVGLDRITLGVHYVSDVVAAWIVALGVVASTATAFEVWRRATGHRPSSVDQGVDPEAAPEITEPTTGSD